jgi:hypothetical protein
MLPLIARQIIDAVRQFLKSAFPITTPQFRRGNGRTVIDDFLETGGR